MAGLLEDHIQVVNLYGIKTNKDISLNKMAILSPGSATAHNTRISSTVSSGQQVIQLDSGTFNFSGSIDITASNLTFRGAGTGKTILQATANFTNGMFNLIGQPSGLKNITFEDLTFDCNSKTNVQGISIKGGEYADGDSTSDITIRNCTFRNLATTDVGLITIYSGRGSSDRGQVTNVTIEGCVFEDTTKYHIYVNGGQVENLKIRNCTFKNSQYGCIAYNQQNKSDNANAAARSHLNWEISGNTFLNNHRSGTPLSAAIGLIQDVNKTGIRSLKIRNNFFGESQSTVQHYCMNLHSCLDLDISDNTFWKSRTAMSLGQSDNGPYFKTDPSSLVTVRNNKFYRCYNISDFDSTIFTHWVGNRFIETTYGGINPYSRQWPAIYESNFFYNVPTDDSGATLQKAAFSVVANGTKIVNNTIIDDRLLSDPSTAPVLSAVTSNNTGLGSRTYYVKYTWQNDTGETLASSEANISLTNNQLLKITHPYATTYGPPSGAKNVNWYVGTSSNAETKQDYTPIPWQQEYEVIKTTFGSINWTEPITGLIAGTSLPESNTTNAITLYGIYEVSGGSGPLYPNIYENNHFYGNLTEPIFKQSTYKRISRNNFFNSTISSIGEKMVEATPYAQGNVTSTTTFNVGNGEKIAATLTGSITATLSDGHYVGQRLALELTQDGTGSRTATWPNNFKKAGGSLALTTTAAAKDRIEMEWDGTNWVEVARALNVS